MVQESYLLVYRKLSQLKKEEAFMGWLCRLGRHAAYRFRDTNPEHLELKSLAGTKTAPQERVLSAMVLQQALNQLTWKDREVLVLRELLFLSYSEISVALAMA